MILYYETQTKLAKNDKKALLTSSTQDHLSTSWDKKNSFALQYSTSSHQYFASFIASAMGEVSKLLRIKALTKHYSRKKIIGAKEESLRLNNLVSADVHSY